MTDQLTIEQVFQIGLQHHRSGRLAQAEKCYQKILEARPDNPDCLHLLGVIRHQQNNNVEAIRLIGLALVQRPDAAEYDHNIAEACRAIGRLDDARQHYERALAVNPDYLASLISLGTIYSFLGQPEAGIARLVHALELEPGNIRANMAMANALTEQGKLNEARDLLKLLLSRNPTLQEATEKLHNLERRLRLEGGGDENDLDLFRTLRDAIETGRVELEILTSRLSHPDCPVVVDYLQTRFLYFVLIVIPGTLFLLSDDWLIAGIAALAELAIILGAGLPLLHRLQQKTTRRQILGDFNRWKLMWRFGGLTLCLAEDTGKEALRAESPGKDWRIIARALKNARSDSLLSGAGADSGPEQEHHG